MSIVVQARGLHWLEGSSGGGDLCAHGHVDFRVNGEMPTDWEVFEISVSAAALYLLRTLERDTPVSVSEDEIRKWRRTYSAPAPRRRANK